MQPALLAAELVGDDGKVREERRRRRDAARHGRSVPHQEALALSSSFFWGFPFFFSFFFNAKDGAGSLQRPVERRDHHELRARKEAAAVPRTRVTRIHRAPVPPGRLRLLPPSPRQMRVPVELRLVGLAVALPGGVVVALRVPDERQNLGGAVREEEGGERRSRRGKVVIFLRRRLGCCCCATVWHELSRVPLLREVRRVKGGGGSGFVISSCGVEVLRLVIFSDRH